MILVNNKPTNFVVTWFFAAGVFIFLITSNHIQAQTKISFRADNEKLSSVLYRLAIVSNINFTYNSGDEVFSEKVNYKTDSKYPMVILNDLLVNTNQTYKKLGNQIVIYQSKDDELNKGKKAYDSSENKIAHLQPKQADTLWIVDTLIIQDTVFSVLTDTIRVSDTVFIEKQKLKKPTQKKIKDIPIDYFNPKSTRESGWVSSLFVSPIFSNFTLAKEENNFSFRNLSLGIEASKIINNWNLTGGLKLTHFSEKFNHTYIDTFGGFYLTDTVDSYYTVIQNDTAWYYITDSTWQPVDSYEYNYNIANRVGYIELALSVSFDYFSTDKIRLYIKTGLQFGVLVYRNGLAIPNTKVPEGIDFADLSFSSTSYSALLGTGFKYRIHQQFDINTEVYYLKYFNEMVHEYPRNTKIQGVAIRFGLMYYF